MVENPLLSEMSAYTEKNFDACLDAIITIKSQRDKAIAIAEAYRNITPEIDDINGSEYILASALSGLKLQVAEFQKPKELKMNQAER
jgi:hypothetical protein